MTFTKHCLLMVLPSLYHCIAVIILYDEESKILDWSHTSLQEIYTNMMSSYIHLFRNTIFNIYTTNCAFAPIHIFLWFHCSQENTWKEVDSSWISTHYTERIHKTTEDGNPAPQQITCISTVTSTFNFTEKLQHLFPIAFLVGLLYDYFRTPDKNKIAKMICQAAIASK